LRLPTVGRGWAAHCTGVAAGIAERLLGLRRLEHIYQSVGDRNDGRSFVERALAEMRIGYAVTDEDRARIPRQGPVVVVANHPFGAAEGLVLHAILTAIRPDVRIMANHILGRINEMRDSFILVDPYERQDARRANVRPIRQCIEWLEGGGVLGVFPAGDVAHLDARRMRVRESDWSPTVVRLACRSGATIVPVFFSGRNSTLFQVLGLVHPVLRTLLLPRQLVNKQGKVLDVRIGRPVLPARLQGLGGDEAAAEYLRRRTLMLGRRRNPATSPTFMSAVRLPLLRAGRMKPVAAAGNPDAMAAEVAALPPERTLVEAAEHAVHIASAGEIPQVLREIGRLRELTFRAAGEGTGRTLDLDEFDSHYLHLFVWGRSAREIVGAYRLGCGDTILRERGPAGFYTHGLFEYGEALLSRMKPAALELGRSFVRQECQRSFQPLLLLWRGIARYVQLNPRYRYLFGPVSISAAYHPISQRVMVDFLKTRHGLGDYESLVSARMPFRITDWRNHELPTHGFAEDAGDIDDLVSDLEADGKGMPVLVRQYLKLGAKFIAFNVDRNFGNCVDGLMVVDLARTEPRTLGRYMGRTEAASYQAAHLGVAISGS